MKSLKPWLATAASLLCVAMVVQAQTTTLDGRYMLVPERSSDIAAAITTLVADMNFVKRPIARSRLKKTNAAYQRVSIARQDGQIRVTFDDRTSIQMPADGSAVKWKRDDGEVFDVSASSQDSELVQTFIAEDGKRVNTFRSSTDGSEMVLEVRISSAQLPKPLTYSLTYRRI